VITINNLPKRTKAQKIGESAAAILDATLSEFCNVVPVPQSRDLGIDFNCEVMDGESPTSLIFHAQCKGKDEVNDNNGSISVSLKVTTINYWLSQRSPVFLFVYDRHSENFFWCFPKAFVSSLNKNWQSQQYISLPIPVSSKFSRNATEIPPDILNLIKTEDLYKKFSDLREEQEELRGRYEAELDYQTTGMYEEYWADVMLEEWK
jgi:hypothetical protein